jgi:hypothetical protein
MSHLSSSQFADAAEGLTPPAVAEHLDECGACRATLAELRSTLADAGLPQPAEPSPLFWDHFSRRVRAATGAEAVPWRLFPWRPVVLLAGLAAAVVLAVTLRENGAPAAPPLTTRAAATANAASDAASADDATVEILSAVSGDLSFDEARAADLLPSRGSVALAVDRLTDDQKRELLRIVREELGALQ